MMSSPSLFQSGPPGQPTPFQSRAPGTPYLAPQPIGGMGHSSDDTELPVSVVLLANPWNDGHEGKLKNGDLLFTQRHNDMQAALRTTVVELHKLNAILAQGWALFQKTLDYDSKKYSFGTNSSDDNVAPEMYALQRTLMNPTESIAEYHLKDLRRKFAEAVKRLDDDDDGIILPSEAEIFLPQSDVYREIEVARATVDLQQQYDERRSNLLTLMADQRTALLRYATLYGVLATWNFFGVVNNTSQGKGLQQPIERPMFNARNGRGSAVGVIFENRTRTFNRWGDVNEGDTLYLILKRRRLNPESSWHNSEWGQFEFVPWSGSPLEHVPAEKLLYKDIAGIDAMGFVIAIGMVSKRLVPARSEQMRRRACGLAPDETGLLNGTDVDTAFALKGELDMLEIILRTY